MKHFIWTLCFLVLSISNVFAVNMVQKEDVLKRPLVIAGLADYPPFSYYTLEKMAYTMHSAFLEPLQHAFRQYSFSFKDYNLSEEQYGHPPMLTLAVRSGEINVFIGAMLDTKLFTGMELIYPAVIHNPIHVITASGSQDKIKSTSDLQKLKGVVCKQEYFSDFVMRKLKPFNLQYVDTPYQAYEKLFTGEVDYMIGSEYFNRFVSCQYGLNRYLTYSKTPLFRIPIFIALSKMTPVLSEYVKAFNDEVSKPEFAMDVKREIIHMIEEEERKNDGVVPPAFAYYAEKVDEAPQQEEVVEEEAKSSGYIVEKEVKEKTLEEVLEGL